METHELTQTAGLFEFLDGIRSHYGLVVLFLVIHIAFLSFFAWQLWWRLWKDSLKTRDQQIARLANERDTYQAMVFERLRASEALFVQARKVRLEVEDDEDASVDEVH
jgi:hypothetical protein